jgi:hypothetical protein
MLHGPAADLNRWKCNSYPCYDVRGFPSTGSRVILGGGCGQPPPGIAARLRRQHSKHHHRGKSCPPSSCWSEASPRTFCGAICSITRVRCPRSRRACISCASRNAKAAACPPQPASTGPPLCLRPAGAEWHGPTAGADRRSCAVTMPMARNSNEKKPVIASDTRPTRASRAQVVDRGSRGRTAARFSHPPRDSRLAKCHGEALNAVYCWKLRNGPRAEQHSSSRLSQVEHHE